jgi:hypothetical protein
MVLEKFKVKNFNSISTKEEVKTGHRIRVRIAEQLAKEYLVNHVVELMSLTSLVISIEMIKHSRRLALK